MPDHMSVSRPHRWKTREKCSKSLVVSLMPTTLWIVAPQAGDRLRCDVDGGSDRHVVQHDRHLRERAGHRRVPLVQAVLRRPRVVRRDHERDVGAEVDRRLRQLERLVELGRPGAWHERHSIGDGVGRDPHRGDPLGDRLGARLAGRPAERDAVRAGLELPCDERAQAVVVDLTVGPERRDDRSDRTADGGRVRTEPHASTSWSTVVVRRRGTLVGDAAEQVAHGAHAVARGRTPRPARPVGRTRSARSTSRVRPHCRSPARARTRTPTAASCRAGSTPG